MNVVPRVSVLMSVYDGVALPEMEAAIESIQSQTLKAFELLIMQDEVRRADLADRLTRFAREDARIRLFFTPKRSGLAAAMNRLLKEAVAPFLARMDADDVSYPERLEKQAAFLETHADMALVGCMTHEIDAAGRIVFHKLLPTDSEAIRRLHCYRDPFVHPSVMFRRDIFQIVGPYSERSETHLLEDTELWSRVLLSGKKTANLPDFLYGFRVNHKLYERRGGFRHGWRELMLRWSYVRRARFAWHRYLPALGVVLVRLGPTGLRKRAYQWCRPGRPGDVPHDA